MSNYLEVNKKALDFANHHIPIMQQFTNMLHSLGIKSFYYVKVYYDSGKYLHLGPVEDLNNYYTENVRNPSPVLAQFIEGEFNEFIWPNAAMDIQKDYFFNWLHARDIGNGLFIRRCLKEYYECWSFSASVQDTQIINAYSAMRPQLYRFIKYFNHVSKGMLEEAQMYLGQYQNPIKMPVSIITSPISETIPWIYKDKTINLSKRQLECLTHIGKGFTYKQVAMEFEKSERTIEFHMNEIKKKLGVRYLTDVINFYNQNMECSL